MLSSRLAEGSDADSTRIAAQIVSGIGFLGAGVILRQQGHVVGLTTAAVIWLAAALGMAVGAEMYALSVVVTVLTMIVLWIFPHFEAWVDQLQENRSYVVTLAINRDKFDMLDTIFRSSSLVIKGHALHKSGENMICTWHTYGAPTTHNDIMNTLFNDPDVIQFEF
jgi:putative Mg2+ transporter-C (MgtC) family protein